VLTRDERGGETDNQVVAAFCPNAEWRDCGERDIVIDVNEWCRPGISSEAQLGASSSSYEVKWDVDQRVSASTRFVPTRDSRYRANFNLRRRKEEEPRVINRPRQGEVVVSKWSST
jgi:hypothetical protein